MITLEGTRDCLRTGRDEIVLAPEVSAAARRALERMIELS